jgi:hypothetical protein
MQNDLFQDGVKKVVNVVAHHTMLARVIVAIDNFEFLNQFVHLGILYYLDD